MNKEKEYIFYEFDEDYKVIKLSVLGEYFTDDSNKLMKNSEALLKRVFPEKSNEHIKTISIFDENEPLFTRGMTCLNIHKRYFNNIFKDFGSSRFQRRCAS